MWEWMDHAIGVLLNRVASMDEMLMHRPPAIFFGGLIWKQDGSGPYIWRHELTSDELDVTRSPLSNTFEKPSSMQVLVQPSIYT